MWGACGDGIVAMEGRGGVEPPTSNGCGRSHTVLLALDVSKSLPMGAPEGAGASADDGDALDALHLKVFHDPTTQEGAVVGGKPLWVVGDDAK